MDSLEGLEHFLDKGYAGFKKLQIPCANESKEFWTSVALEPDLDIVCGRSHSVFLSLSTTC